MFASHFGTHILFSLILAYLDFSPAKGLKMQGPNFGYKPKERDQGGLPLALLLVF